MKKLGKHYIVEYYDCDEKILDDEKKLVEYLLGCVKKTKTTLVGKVSHHFSPYGVSAVVLIAESHFSIHTWIEHKYAAVDFFTCGETMPDKALVWLGKKLRSKSGRVQKLDRGIL